MSFGLYAHEQPYAAGEANKLALICQVIIFFTLLSSLCSANASGGGDAALDVLLMIVTFTPLFLIVYTQMKKLKKVWKTVKSLIPCGGRTFHTKSASLPLAPPARPKRATDVDGGMKEVSDAVATVSV